MKYLLKWAILFLFMTALLSFSIIANRNKDDNTKFYGFIGLSLYLALFIYGYLISKNTGLFILLATFVIGCIIGFLYPQEIPVEVTQKLPKIAPKEPIFPLFNMKGPNYQPGTGAYPPYPI